MKTVSNSSPLVGLAAIGHFPLLRRYFGRIYIPQAVYREVAMRGKGRAGDQETKKAVKDKWAEVAKVKDKRAVKRLIADLEIDQGESEAICLAQELGAERIIVDETKAREYARSLGFKIIGVLGILKLAREEGLIPNLREKLDELGAKGFWIDEGLYHRILKEVGEV
jgi:predicted nucleic acid-binding protein